MSRQSQTNPAAGAQPQPRNHNDDYASSNDFDRAGEDAPIDDPGDAQRSSKSEPDGDGEEG